MPLIPETGIYLMKWIPAESAFPRERSLSLLIQRYQSERILYAGSKSRCKTSPFYLPCRVPELNNFMKGTSRRRGRHITLDNSHEFPEMRKRARKIPLRYQLTGLRENVSVFPFSIKKKALRLESNHSHSRIRLNVRLKDEQSRPEMHFPLAVGLKAIFKTNPSVSRRASIYLNNLSLPMISETFAYNVSTPGGIT